VSDLDDLRELLILKRLERDEAGRACASHVRDLSGDTEAYQLADRWAVLDSEVRRLERLIAVEVAG